MEQPCVAKHERLRRVPRRRENSQEGPEFSESHQWRKYTATDNETHPIRRENAQESMPQKTRNGAGTQGAATDQEAAQDKEHRDRNQPDCVASVGEGLQAIDSEPSQGKAVGENHENRQGEPEEPESIILRVKCVGETALFVSGLEVGGAHPASASRNRSVAGSRYT